jgi:dATP pyrophosphohydrolase
VLVVIYTPALDVLLLRRADALDYWQSVTGSKDALTESYAETAAREVFEETGIACGPGSGLASNLQDWCLENVYDIYPAWRKRYAPGVTRNTEHLFGLRLPTRLPVVLNPLEHTAYQWLAQREAATVCSSASNAEAILMLSNLLARGPQV